MILSSSKIARIKISMLTFGHRQQLSLLLNSRYLYKSNFNLIMITVIFANYVWFRFHIKYLEWFHSLFNGEFISWVLCVRVFSLLIFHVVHGMKIIFRSRPMIPVFNLCYSWISAQIQFISWQGRMPTRLMFKWTSIDVYNLNLISY